MVPVIGRDWSDAMNAATLATSASVGRRRTWVAPSAQPVLVLVSTQGTTVVGQSLAGEVRPRLLQVPDPRAVFGQEQRAQAETPHPTSSYGGRVSSVNLPFERGKDTTRRVR
jgi:hypothetical protein